MKPNIFNIATKELSQDSFITWLLLWANYPELDINLCNCSKEFIGDLIKKKYRDFDDDIKVIDAGRQWDGIDVWAKVNNTYLIIIEDKTNTAQHSNQLSRYKKIAEEWCEKHSYKEPICIYLKTGNESLKSLSFVQKENYSTYNRKNFLELIKIHSEITNDIFNDFKVHLTNLEQSNNDFINKPLKDWKGPDWQGFFQFVESEIYIENWNFVNNPNKGFWCAVLNWESWNSYPVYLQIEEKKLCFKISTHPGDVKMPPNVNRSQIRNELSNSILKEARSKGLTQIRKPDRFGNGKYMTIAVIDGENWLGNEDEKINKNSTIENLKFYKQFLLDVIR